MFPVAQHKFVLLPFLKFAIFQSNWNDNTLKGSHACKNVYGAWHFGTITKYIVIKIIRAIISFPRFYRLTQEVECNNLFFSFRNRCFVLLFMFWFFQCTRATETPTFFPTRKIKVLSSKLYFIFCEIWVNFFQQKKVVFSRKHVYVNPFLRVVHWFFLIYATV